MIALGQDAASLMDMTPEEFVFVVNAMIEGLKKEE